MQGERGAVKIYEGQLLALNTLVKDEALKKTIEKWRVHEKEHSNFFEEEIKKRNIKPTKFLPLWDLLGVGLGFGSTLLGKKAAMLCTASVEEVIDEHYLNQIKQLDNSESKLKKKIIKFREDELNHKDIAYEKVLQKKGPYSILDKIIKTGSKIAINISEKIIKALVLHPNISNPSNFYVKNLAENFYHFCVDPLLMVDKGTDTTSFQNFLKVFHPFLTLHAEQAVTTLSQLVSPPFDLGNKWSKVNSSLLPQYWQENLSLKKTLNLVKLGFDLRNNIIFNAITLGNFMLNDGLLTVLS